MSSDFVQGPLRTSFGLGASDETIHCSDSHGDRRGDADGKEGRSDGMPIATFQVTASEDAKSGAHCGRSHRESCDSQGPIDFFRGVERGRHTTGF